MNKKRSMLEIVDVPMETREVADAPIDMFEIIDETMDTCEPVELIAVYEDWEDSRYKKFWENPQASLRQVLPLEKIIFQEKNAFVSNKNIMHLLVMTDEQTKTEVTVCGKGRPILLLNGFGIASPQWTRQYSQFNDEYMMININIPGVGLSESIPDFTYEDIADTVIKVLAAIGVEDSFHIIASSWGGIIGQILAVKFPGKIISLILSGCFYKLKYHAMNEMTIRDKIRLDCYNIHAQREYEELVRYQALNSSSKGYIKYANEGFDIEDMSEKVPVPTLIIAGGKDTVITYEEAEELHERIENSVLFRIEGAGHLANITHHQQFNNAVRAFINTGKIEGGRRFDDGKEVQPTN